MLKYKCIPILFLICWAAYGQDETKGLLDRYTELIEERIEIIKEKEILIDSIKSLNNKLENDKVDRVQVLLSMQNLNDSLRTRIKSLEEENKGLSIKDGLIKENKTFKDSVIVLNKYLKDINTELNKVNIILDNKPNELRNAEEKGYIQGQNDLYLSITNAYLEMSFDDLLQASTPIQIERDLNFLTKDSETALKLSDALKYFEVQKLLSKRFNPENNAEGIHVLEEIHFESSLVSKLIVDLKGYKNKSERLKRTLEHIASIEEKFIANNRETEDYKLDLIGRPLSDYIYNNIFNFNDYPYLGSIIHLLIEKKRRNANADISGLIEQL